MCEFVPVDERVAEHLPNRLLYDFFAIKRDVAVEAKPENPKIVQSCYVISMGMSEYRRTDERRAVLQQLQPQLRPGIDHKLTFRSTNEHTGS